MCSLFAQGGFEAAGLSQSMRDELGAVRVIVDVRTQAIQGITAKYSLDTLDKAFAVIRDSSNLLAHALTIYANGQHLVQAAERKKESIRLSNSRIDGAIQCMRSLQELLPAAYTELAVVAKNVGDTLVLAADVVGKITQDDAERKDRDRGCDSDPEPHPRTKRT